MWGPGGDALLDWLDVPRRHRTERESELDADRESDLAGLVLLDLPDHDSTRVEHRVEVDRMVALVDLLVWVVDPQKYADQALHAGYLRDLGDHDAVTLLVLNQVDTLDAADVEACRRDLRRLLAGDGLADVQVLATSALTGAGVADLRAHVAATVAARSAVEERARADLVRASRALRAGVGDSEPDPDGGVGRDQLVDALADAAGVPAVVRAVEADHRRRAAGHVGWPFTRWLRRLRPDPLRRLRLGGDRPELTRMTRSSLPEPTQSQRARVGLATRRVAQGASRGLPPRWAGAVREAADPGGEDLSDALDQAVTGVDLQRRTPWWWPVAGLLQVLLAVAAVAGLGWLVVLGVLDVAARARAARTRPGTAALADRAAARRAAGGHRAGVGRAGGGRGRGTTSRPAGRPRPAPAGAGRRRGAGDGSRRSRARRPRPHPGAAGHPLAVIMHLGTPPRGDHAPRVRHLAVIAESEVPVGRERQVSAGRRRPAPRFACGGRSPQSAAGGRRRHPVRGSLRGVPPPAGGGGTDP